jgi:hypothetical protein
MKTTLDLPDALLRRVKMLAVERNLKLKDAVAQLLERGLGAASEPAAPTPVPTPVRLKGRRLDIDRIEAAINTGRD